MFKGTAKRIIKYAVRNNYIAKEDAEAQAYGLELFLTILLNDVTVLVIGAAAHMLLEAVFFWLIYKAMKKYTGGYHFDNAVVCYLSTVVMAGIVLILVKYCEFNVYIYSALTAADALLLIILSPVAAINKPLDEKETRVFRVIAWVLVLAVTSIYVILILCEFNYAAKIPVFSMTSVAVFALAGKIEHIIKKQQC
mgnify:CR=1 FL=1